MTLAASTAVPCLPKVAPSSKGASAGRFSSSQFSCIKGVYIAPGATALTRIWRGPTSFAAAFVRPITPCLLAE